MVASRLFLHPSSCSHLARWAGNPLNRSVIWPTQTPRITPTCNLLHAAPLAASPSASRPGQHRRLCHTAAAVDHAVASPTDQPLGYRQNVGVCLVNRDGLVFAARRIDDTSQTWQMPQGGIDEGEEPHVAAVRELTEETGVSSARIVGEVQHWLQYDFPPEVLAHVRRDGRRHHRGQRQKWFLMLFEGDNSEVDLQQPEPEFSEFKWVDIHQMPLYVVPFKREVYERVVREFAPLISGRLKDGKWVA